MKGVIYGPPLVNGQHYAVTIWTFQARIVPSPINFFIWHHSADRNPRPENGAHCRYINEGIRR